MEAVTLFTDIVQFPDLRSLNFGEVPRTIRFKIYNMIPHFTQLRVLIIGPGGSLSNQGSSWIPIKVHTAHNDDMSCIFTSLLQGKAASELASHLSNLHHLEHFSLKKDCNLKILQSLVEASSKTLKHLDIENSNFLQVCCS